MDESDIVGLTPEFADRVLDATERAEATYRNGPQPPRPAPGRTDVNVQKLRVTSGTPLGTVNGIDYYPAVPTKWVPDPDGDWSSLFAAATAVVFDESNPGFESNQLVWGRQVAGVTIDGYAWPTFAMMAGGLVGVSGSGIGAGGPCPSWDPDLPGWVLNGLPASSDQLCGCEDDPAYACWPYWKDKNGNNIDLLSTGIAAACLLDCFDGSVAARRACLVIVPGGPFGFRLALISADDGTELHESS